MRCSEGIRVDKLRSNYQQPDPESESKGTLGYPSRSDGAKNNASESTYDQVFEEIRVGSMKETVGSAAKERQQKTEDNVGADHLCRRKRG